MIRRLFMLCMFCLAAGGAVAGVLAPAREGKAPPSASRAPAPAALPIAPRPYTIPAHHSLASTSRQLVSALAHLAAKNIVLADGTYTTKGTNSATPYFQNSRGDRLWAAHPGRALLRAGLSFGGNWGRSGGEVHGLAFNIVDPSLAANSAAIYSWGHAGVGTKVYDTRIEGNYVLAAGIDFYAVQGIVIERVVASHLRSYGIRVSDNAPEHDSTAQARAITDVSVDDVREFQPESSWGTAEFGVWIGNRVASPVERVRSEHGWQGGLWVGGSSRDTSFRDVTVSSVDRPNGGVAVYLEHFTDRDSFSAFNLGPHVAIGFNCEWNYGHGDGACNHDTFENGTIASSSTGLFLDQGQKYNVAHDLRFLGQRCAAIVDNQGVDNIYTHNDYSNLASGSVILADYC